VITLPCRKCGAEIPYPADDVSALECPSCHAVRDVKVFRAPRAWQRWQNWTLFERPRAEAAKAAQR
jgi:hypothetical protein